MESKETVTALRAAGEHGPLLATERMAYLAIGWQPSSMRQARCPAPPQHLPVNARPCCWPLLKRLPLELQDGVDTNTPLQKLWPSQLMVRACRLMSGGKPGQAA